MNKHNNSYMSIVPLEMPVDYSKKSKPMARERVESVVNRVRRMWEEFLPPSLLLFVDESEQYWKIKGKDEGFSSCGIIDRRRIYEDRVVDVSLGILNDYFLYRGYFPRGWVEK